MGEPTGPGRYPRRVQPHRRRTSRTAASREHDARVVNAMLLAVIAGLVCVVLLVVLSAVTGTGTAATVGITAVTAIVSAATGVAASYLRRRK
jgi:hypothetical protein